jgi:hypothetical protein
MIHEIIMDKPGRENIIAHSPLLSRVAYSTVSEAFASLFSQSVFEYRQKKPLKYSLSRFMVIPCDNHRESSILGNSPSAQTA